MFFSLFKTCFVVVKNIDSSFENTQCRRSQFDLLPFPGFADDEMLVQRGGLRVSGRVKEDDRGSKRRW